MQCMFTVATALKPVTDRTSSVFKLKPLYYFTVTVQLVLICSTHNLLYTVPDLACATILDAYMYASWGTRAYFKYSSIFPITP